MLIAHILFGIMLLIGTLMLGISFHSEFNRLTTMQKTAIVLTIAGTLVTIVLGMFLAQGNVFAGVIAIALVAAFVASLFMPKLGKQNNK